MKDKRIVFMGTPDFAVPILEMLIHECDVVGVVTQPDKVVGRKKELQYSPIKKLALDNGIQVFQPKRIREEYGFLHNLDIDLIVTCAFGQIVPKEVLDIPKLGCINVHASILPKYRGAAPIQWALFNGDKKTGVTIMYMDEGMDTGDIIEINEIEIDEIDNVGTLHDKLSVLGRDTLKEVLPKIFNGTSKRIKQGDNYSMAPKVLRSDERLDFNNKGRNIINRIRGLNPWPLANIILDGLEIKIIDAEFKKCSVKGYGKIVEITKSCLGISCLDGKILLKTIKPSGKKVMKITDFINGIDKNKYLNMEVNSGE